MSRPLSLDFLSSMDLHPQEQLSTLFQHPPVSTLDSWVGPSAATSANEFLDTLHLSYDRFHKSSSVSANTLLAAAMPQLDPAAVSANDLDFILDPLATIAAVASRFDSFRLSSAKLLLNPHYHSASTDLKYRLSLLSNTIDPVYDPRFVPDIHTAIARPNNAAAAPIMSVLLWKSSQKGEVLIVHRNAFTESLASHGLHGSIAYSLLAQKPDDIGRLCYDYSFLGEAFPINGGDLKPLYIQKFGRMFLPSYKDYIDLIFDAFDTFPGESIKIAKFDISRYYHRSRWSTSSSLLMSVLVNHDLIAIPITPGFGKGEVPYLFQAYSLFCDHCHLQRNLQKGIPYALGRMYIDDQVTFGSDTYLVNESKAQIQQVSQDIHPDAVNVDKIAISAADNVIGVRTDSLAFRCGISHKSYLKLCYVFFILLPTTISTGTMISLHSIQCLSSLAYYNGQYIPLLRCTGSIFFKALRGRTHRARSLSIIQIECIKLWRSFLLFAFTHSSVLSSTMYEVYHNNANVYPISRRATTGPTCYTDAELQTLGSFVPHLGFCQIHLIDLLPSGTTLSIAHYELIAFIITFLLAIFLNDPCTSIHIFVDNTNALSWSTGRIGTNDLCANILTLSNCMLQAGFKVTQTRSYIRSQDNKDADEISRRKFSNSNNLTQFYPTSPLLKFFRKLLNPQEVNVSQILPSILTILDLPVSSLFAPYSTILSTL
jgi:hypothetical protein